MSAFATRPRLWFALVLALWADGVSAQAASNEPDWLVPGGQAFSASERDSLVFVHLGRIETLAFREDGAVLASGGEDGTLCLWELSTGRPTRCVGPSDQGAITSLAFNRQQPLLAAGRSDGSIDLIRPEGSATEPRCLPAMQGDKQKLGRGIVDLGFAGRDGRLISTGARSQSLQVCSRSAQTVGDASAGSLPISKSLPPLSGLSNSLLELAALDGNGERMAVYADGTVGLWETQTGRLLWQKKGVPSLPVSIALSADGQRLALGLLDGRILAWQLPGGTETQLPKDQPTAHRGAVRSLKFARDGRVLLSGSDDNSLALWDVDSRRLIREQPLGRVMWTALALRADGGQWAAALSDGTIAVWDSGTGQLLRALRGNADTTRALAWGAEGQLLAVASDDQHVRVWRRSAAASLSGSATRPSASAQDRWILTCDTGPLGTLQAMTFQPGSAGLLAVALDDRYVQLIDVPGCKRRVSLPEASGWHKSVAFSSDGRHLASGTDDGSIYIWQLKDSPAATVSDFAAEKAHVQRHRDEVRALAYNPSDANLLASGSLDKTVRLWESPSGKELHVFPEQREGIRFVAFSPDGKLLATAAGKEVVLWDVARRALADASHPSLQHTQPVHGMGFSADGALLLTADGSGQIHLWDRGSQKSLSPLSPFSSHGQTGQGADMALGALAVEQSRSTNAIAVAKPGRVAVWQPQPSGDPLGPRAWQWQELALLLAAGDAWAMWTPMGRLFRHDTGDLLWQRRGLDGLRPLPPPLGTPQLEWSIARSAAGQGLWQAETLNITVRNRSQTDAAYWLRAQASPDGGPPPPRFASQPSPTVHRLDPGEQTELTIRLAPLRRLGSFQLPPRQLRVCIQLHQAQQDGGSCEGPLSQHLNVAVGPWWWRSLWHLPWLGLTLLFAVWIARRQLALRIPFMRSVDAGQDPILTLSLAQLDEAVHRRWMGWFFLLSKRHRQALDALSARRAALARIQAAWTSAERCAQILADQLGAAHAVAATGGTGEGQLQQYALSLPSLSLHLPNPVSLLFCNAGTVKSSTQSASPAEEVLLHCASDELRGVPFAIVIDLAWASPRRSFMQARAALARIHPGVVFALLDEPTLRQILLAPDTDVARALLREQIVAQCEPTQIVSYHEGGGIPPEEQALFFGRQSELERLLRGYRHNFLLAGPRQMGKSSLINALLREMKRHRPDVLVLKYDPLNGQLAGMEEVDRSLCADTPEQFFSSVMRRSQAHQVFLLDETDAFIAQEARTQYAFTHVMRALSSQGRASFVLAGYRDLLDATRQGEHPLRNFGEVLRLEPLDPESAERMILDPLTAVGLRFETPRSVVDWIREQTACRPHLLSKLCYQLVKLRQPASAVPLSLTQVQQALLDAEFLHDVFGSWDHRAVMPLDRAVMRACLLLGAPRSAALLRYLHQQGAQIHEDELEQSLHRLYAWHYALIVDAEDRIVCPVPLLRHFLSDPQPDRPFGSRFSDSEARLREQLSQDILEIGR